MIPPEVEALVQDRSRYERSARRVVDHANNICTEVNCWPSIIKLIVIIFTMHVHEVLSSIHVWILRLCPAIGYSQVQLLISSKLENFLTGFHIVNKQRQLGALTDFNFEKSNIIVFLMVQEVTLCSCII